MQYEMLAKDVWGERAEGSDTGRIMRALGTLNNKERWIIELRYGLTEEGLIRSADQIAEEYGTTRMNVLRIERLAMSKLKRYPI